MQTGLELALKIVEGSEKGAEEEASDKKLGEEITKVMDVCQQFQQQEHLLHSC